MSPTRTKHNSNPSTHPNTSPPANPNLAAHAHQGTTENINQKFIVFEGLDGAGKSTLLHLLKAELIKHGQDVLTTREPGGTDLGEELRHIILRKEGDAPTPRTELLLYEAIRAQHVDKIIRPKLRSGGWVLCDRFVASSIAFQAGGRQISEPQVQWLNSFATSDLTPFVTVLLDLSYEEALARQQQRFQKVGESADRMESEHRDFHERVRQSFLRQSQESLSASEQSHWIVLSALQSPESLLETLVLRLKEKGLWVF